MARNSNPTGRRIIVTPRSGPDLDGAACAVAYAELLCVLGGDAHALIDGRPDGEARFALAELGCAPPRPTVPSPADIVLVDASDVLGLPSVVAPQEVVEVIDHRLHHEAERLFPRARVQIEPVGAAATLVTERWRAAGGVAPSETAVLLLQAAIQSNTQALRGSVTTPRDLAAHAWLSELQHLPEGFVARQFAARTSDLLNDVPGALARESKTFAHPEGAFVVSQLEVTGGLGVVPELEAEAERLGPRHAINVVDVNDAASWLIVSDPTFRQWVAARLGVAFVGAVARFPRARLRKQIVAALLGYST